MTAGKEADVCASIKINCLSLNLTVVFNFEFKIFAEIKFYTRHCYYSGMSALYHKFETSDFFYGATALIEPRPLIVQVSRSHTDTHTHTYQVDSSE